MRLVLFDIDGTLIHTGGAGLRALRRTFAELHGIPDAAAHIDFHGLTDPVIVQSIARGALDRDLDPPEYDRLVVRYLDHLDDTLRTSPAFRVLPGARELLEELARRDEVVLGLATGNFEPAAFAKLRRAGLDGFFDFGGYGSDSHDRGELTRIAVARGRRRTGNEASVVLVGDTVHDVRSAAAAGVDCLAVATGNATVETLRAEGARWTVPHLEDPRTREVLGLH